MEKRLDQGKFDAMASDVLNLKALRIPYGTSLFRAENAIQGSEDGVLVLVTCLDGI